MNNIKLLVFLMLASHNVVAQIDTPLYTPVDTTVVPFVSYWSIGDSYDFRITKIKRTWEDGVLDKNDSTSYDVKFLVMDSTENSYTIKWSYESDLLGDFNFDIPEEARNKLTEFDFSSITYKTSEVGDFQGIENWEEYAKMVGGFFEELMASLAKEEGSEAELKQFLEPLLAPYQTKQGIEQVIFKELQYFHLPMGVEFEVAEPFYYQEELPNMFGGAPIRGDAKIYFESVDFQDEFCVLIQEMQLNEEDTRAIILDLFKKMGMEDEDMKKAMETARFDIRDYNRFEYFYYPGVPYFIETNRTSLMEITSEKRKREEIIRIALLLD